MVLQRFEGAVRVTLVAKEMARRFFCHELDLVLLSQDFDLMRKLLAVEHIADEAAGKGAAQSGQGGGKSRIHAGSGNECGHYRERAILEQGHALHKGHIAVARFTAAAVAPLWLR
jgi:hypothetical protein